MLVDSYYLRHMTDNWDFFFLQKLLLPFVPTNTLPYFKWIGVFSSLRAAPGQIWVISNRCWNKTVLETKKRKNRSSCCFYFFFTPDLSCWIYILQYFKWKLKDLVSFFWFLLFSFIFFLYFLQMISHWKLEYITSHVQWMDSVSVYFLLLLVSRINCVSYLVSVSSISYHRRLMWKKTTKKLGTHQEFHFNVREVKKGWFPQNVGGALFLQKRGGASQRG